MLSVMVKTSLPLYVPHLGHTVWGRFGSPHWGQREVAGLESASWLLRLFLLDLLCLFFGLGILHPSLSWYLITS